MISDKTGNRWREAASFCRKLIVWSGCGTLAGFSNAQIIV